MLVLPLAALWQQKTRTVLTTLGVIFGSFVLAASLSIGQGVQDIIKREYHKSDLLRKITVYPQWQPPKPDKAPKSIEVPGRMSDAKRERIRTAIAVEQARSASKLPRAALTEEMLSELSRIDHVEVVVPLAWQSGFVVFKDQSQPTAVAAARPLDPSIQKRIVAGQMFFTPTDSSALISEFLLYRLGVIDDDAVTAALGQKLRLEFRGQASEGGIGIYLMKPQGGETTREETIALERLKERIPQALDRLDLTPAETELLRKAIQVKPPQSESVMVRDFTIAGVVRMRTVEEEDQSWDPLRVDADLILPFQTASDLYFEQPGPRERTVHQAVIIVDSEQHTREVYAKVRELGLNAHAVLEHIERQRLMYLLIFGGMTCVAGVALLVAALGIANTMLMSVLERMREIGIMKALGAANSQVQLIFIIEGAIIGLLGGAIGLLLAFAASFPGDAWVRSMVSRDLKIELTDSIFVFPPWLILTVLAFAIVVTTLAAVYPARRAAKIDPVAALRHE
jgi:putative ABC transport system permease protein